ncbi:chromosome segregation protein SMC [Rothia sp. CCM 9416]|uniref:chromosome segregation protein SMC n=1 Tax=Rothia sp. CCM 9416 TaxID=3402655 RepID=UPI003AE56008
MYLKSLTVRGFKSFASATVFEFEPGLNVIVGPNGSGKSNVADALAWVMGAQGAKQLRGAAMKDVIFAGGGERGALGRAKVELVIDNSDGSLPLPHSEIRITRTMFSAGGSEYEINGQPARLTDVQELLADTGVGKDPYTLVGQGQVDKILHGTAQDRRELIEQAAGLVKHRRRQAKTAAKLDDLKGNLDRLEDLAAELSDQLEGRREQAEAARIASDVAARVRALKGDLLALDGAHLKTEIAEHTEAAEQAAVARARSEEKNLVFTQDLADLTAHEAAIKASLEESMQEVATLKALAARVQTIERVASERIKQANQQDDYADALAHLETARLGAGQEEEAARLAKERVLQAEKELKGLEDISRLAEKDHRQLNQELEQARSEVAEHRELLSQLTTALAAARTSFEKAQAEAARRKDEYQEFESNQAQVSASVEAARATVQALVAEYEQALLYEKQSRCGRQAAADAQEKSRVKLQETELALRSAQARYQALEAAWSQDHESSTEPAGEREKALSAGAQELVSLLEVKPQWQKAVAAVIGPYARVLADKKGRNQPHLVSQVFRPEGMQNPSGQKELSIPELEDKGFMALRQALSAPAALTDALNILLGRVYLCENLVQAQEAVRDFPDITVATADGLLVTSVSVLYPQEVETSFDAHAQLIAAQSHMKDIEKECEEARLALAQNQQGLTLAQEQEKQAARKVGALSARVTTARTDLAGLTGACTSAQAEKRRLTDAAHRADEALKEAAAQLATATDELERARKNPPHPNLADLLERAQEAASTVQQATERLAQARTGLERDRENAQAAHARSLQAQEALNALETAELNRQGRHAQEQAARRQATRLNLAAQALACQLAGLLKEAEKGHENTRSQALTLAEGLSDTREKLASGQKSLAAALTLQAEAAAQRARCETRWEGLENRVRDELGLSLDELIASRSGVAADRAETEKALAQAEAELARLGVTNPLALEEYQALEQRFGYLRQQISDIKASRTDVRAVMKEVNDYIVTSFDSALADVQEQFGPIFATLFPGGQGELVLSDPADRQNSGLEIQVKPAGKKVTRLSLLSGGERTLASLALLLAVFMARPAPFYVLDEVEAALDDRNLGRLLEVLGQLRERSQLLMITHHQRTMAQADTLYGVSMRNGVSAVISQRLADYSQSSEV